MQNNLKGMHSVTVLGQQVEITAAGYFVDREDNRYQFLELNSNMEM